jgi:gliding motility-associated-like protein
MLFMKVFATVLLMVVGIVSFAQDNATEGNKKPQIRDQDYLSVREDESITISFYDLEVRDRDDWYPWGFTLKLYPGTNYTLSGNTVIPAPNFNGKLTVPVTVNDGEDESEKYNLEIIVTPVNDPPTITGQNKIEIDQGDPITITANHLVIQDIDSSYPEDFRVVVVSSSTGTYSISGNTITPSSSFDGTINVELYVRDGDLRSNDFTVAITVKRKNNPPTITGQVPITINEDESIEIKFSHLTVSDPDNAYPTGFSMKINSGENYSVNGMTVTPAENFNGHLVVPVTVNDGQKESNVFPLNIMITPVNDRPVVSALETDPLLYKVGEGEEPLTREGFAFDPDNDSIASAEIRFERGRYQIAGDELIFENTGNIKGTFEIQNGVLSLKGIASLAEYTAAIRSIQYNFIPAIESQFNEKDIEFILNDGTGEGEVTVRKLKMTDLDIALDIPDAFTPNGDDANDTWKIKPLKQMDELTNAVVRVYARSGKLVFEGRGFETAWDGKMNGELLPADTYYYTIDLNLKFSKALRSGVVTLLR